jgi:hypothetical protein
MVPIMTETGWKAATKGTLAEEQAIAITWERPSHGKGVLSGSKARVAIG